MRHRCTADLFAVGVMLLLRSSGFAEAASFSEAGLPFLEKHCVECHGPKKQKGGLVLDRFNDELSVLRARRQWKEIVELVRSGEMPPEKQPQPTAAERQKFLDSVASVFAHVDRAPPDPGRPVQRRLNRNEYNNTIRDLLKVDFRPADDFPRDDVGYGFENIGDVLSVSPVLMERYLDAAERIAAQAIPVNPLKPPKRTLAAMYCEPASPHTPRDRFRPICAAEKEAIHSGPLNTPVTIAADGEYLMRARLYARSANGKPVRLALFVTGEGLARTSPEAEIAQIDGAQRIHLKRCLILKVVEVTARNEAQAQIVEAKISRIKGAERISIAPLKPPGGEPAPTLFVEYLECEGPLDARSPATKALMVFSPGKSERDQTRELLWRFVSRAWRRPVSDDELDRLCKLVAYAVGHGATWEEGLRQALTVVLASPKFIFRLEPDDQPGNPEPHPVNEFQLATRLSYFLWSSTPDEQLLQLATEGKLRANLDAQLRRMLQDPRAEALVENFVLQWLQIGRLATHSADDKTFPRWRPTLRASMIEESRRFCAEILRGNRTIFDLLDADFTWMDRRIAEIYKIAPPDGFAGDEWKRVSLRGSARGGLLTQLSVLTVTSNPTRTSPVKRGKWVLEQILGDPPPPAPPDVPSLDDAHRKELTGTFRQKLEQHRADPQCAECHAKMDSFGFALENFDGIGQWRERDETGGRVDASAKLPDGARLEGVADLKRYLRERKGEFARCLTEKLLTYALGRGLDYYDDPTVDRIVAALPRDDYRFWTLLAEIVKSPPFQMRRGAAK